MTDSGPNPGGSYSYQKGVWMSKGGSVRSEKYQKWTEDRTKSQVGLHLLQVEVQQLAS